MPSFTPAGPGGRHSARLKTPTKAKDVQGTLRRLLGYLGGQWGLITIVLAASLISTVITVVGTRLNGVAVDRYILAGDLRGLALLCMLMLAIYVVNIAATYVQNVLMIDVAQRTSATLRSDLFRSILHLPQAYFDQHASGDLMSRLTNDVDNVNSTLSQSVTQLFSGVISVGGMFLAMLILSPLLTLFAMIVVPMTTVVSRIIIKRSRRYFSALQRELGELNGYIEEMISGQKAVLLFQQEETVAAEFAEMNSRLQTSYTLAQTFSAMGPFMSFINNITYVVVTLVGAMLVLRGSLSVGVIFTFLLYMRNFSRPLNSLATLFNTIQSALAGAERVFEVIDEQPESDAADAVPAQNIRGDVAASDVSFAYGQEPVLKNASFNVQAGQTIAIVGPTGAGKTTIISLLNRFYDPTGGTITIDGQEIRHFTRDSLRREIGLVLQDTFLFSESIADNIRYGRLEATDEEVVRAAQMADAHGFIMQMANGYDTLLSDNGHNLSQGQRQLLAIARAILSDPALLILDEATSSIDTRTEQIIQASLLKLMQGRTSFVIAHRLSTIKHADQILVVKDGQIIERGTHQALLDQGGFYNELYNSQFESSV